MGALVTISDCGREKKWQNQAIFRSICLITLQHVDESTCVCFCLSGVCSNFKGTAGTPHSAGNVQVLAYTRSSSLPSANSA